MTAPDLKNSLRAFADTLTIAAEAVRDAADELDNAEPAAIASTLNLAALNCSSTALSLSRRVGWLEASNDNSG